MGKYPVDICDEENGKLKFPFLEKEQYKSINSSPDGPVILIRRSREKLTASDIKRMAEINRDIAARRILSEQKNVV